MTYLPPYLAGQIGHFDAVPVVETDVLGGVLPAIVVDAPAPIGRRVYVRRTRPSLEFPLLEAVAIRTGERLWYFDPAKWPDRKPEPLLWLLRAQGWYAEAGEPRPFIDSVLGWLERLGVENPSSLGIIAARVDGADVVLTCYVFDEDGWPTTTGDDGEVVTTDRRVRMTEPPPPRPVDNPTPHECAPEAVACHDCSAKRLEALLGHDRHAGTRDAPPEPCPCPGSGGRSPCTLEPTPGHRLCGPCRDWCWGTPDGGATRVRLVEAYGEASRPSVQEGLT